MLVLEVLLGLNSKPRGVTTAFVHADLPEGKHIYVHKLQGFRMPEKSFMDYEHD